MRSFAPVLQGSRVKWFTDSQAAARIVEVASVKLDLHRMARRIFDICVQALNDLISRLIDADDWQTTNDLFSSLNERWGSHSVDCFANYYNHKLPRFCPRFWSTNTAGIDFFIQSFNHFKERTVWWSRLFLSFLEFFKSQNALGTIDLPFRPSAHYWPLLTNLI